MRCIQTWLTLDVFLKSKHCFVNLVWCSCPFMGQKTKSEYPVLSYVAGHQGKRTTAFGWDSSGVLLCPPRPSRNSCLPCFCNVSHPSMPWGKDAVFFPSTHPQSRSFPSRFPHLLLPSLSLAGAGRCFKSLWRAGFVPLLSTCPQHGWLQLKEWVAAPQLWLWGGFSSKKPSPHTFCPPPPPKASRVPECGCFSKGWCFPLTLATLSPGRWWIPTQMYPVPGEDTRVHPLAGCGAAGGGVPPSLPCWVPRGCVPWGVRLHTWWLPAGWVYFSLLKLDESNHTLTANLGSTGVLQPQLNPLPPASIQLQVSRSLIPWGGVEERIWFAGC